MSRIGREPVVLHASNVQQIVDTLEAIVEQVKPACDTGNSQSIAYRQGVLDSLEVVRQMWIAACLVIGGRNNYIDVEVVD